MEIAQLFKKSEALYTDIVNDISKMADATAVYMHEKGKPFDPELTVAKFDLVLQYSLLQAACSDNVLSKNEIKFIRDLTEYADFCDFVSSLEEKYKTVSWDDLLYFDIAEITALLSDTEDEIRAVSEEVVSVFAAADKADKTDHLSALSDNVFGIVSGLAFADGDEDSEDFRQNILIFECIDKIADLLK